MKKHCRRDTYNFWMAKPKIRRIMNIADMMKRGTHYSQIGISVGDYDFNDDWDYGDEWEDDDWDDIDNSDEFFPCCECDLPDACDDFGCAITNGIREPQPF